MAKSLSGFLFPKGVTGAKEKRSKPKAVKGRKLVVRREATPLRASRGGYR